MNKLILAGGGHAHVEVLRQLALARFNHVDKGVEITLVSPGRYAAYSGMLPGLIAGHYTFDECHIDLLPLAARAGARWVDAHVVKLDPARRVLTLSDGATLPYDILSIDCGSVPVALEVPGVMEHALAVKPVSGFLAGWEQLRVRASAGGVQAIAVVGGGAAGVEVLLAMQYRMEQARLAILPRFHLISDTPRLLSGYPAGVCRVFKRNLARKGVTVHTGARVSAVTAHTVIAGDRRITADAVAWVTGAAPLAWLAASGLARDAKGFLNINHHLQSTADAHVFAAGDCATIAGRVYPKSGVYAVRQGPVLAQNLMRTLRGEPLAGYTPQPRALALISSGERHAIASWGALSWHGNWVWRWKDRIDRAFVAKYQR